MKRVAIGAGAAVALTLLLTGCASQEPAPAQVPAGAATSTPAAPRLDLEQFTPAPHGVIDEDTGETVRPQPVPTWDEQSRSNAQAAASTAMSAFARPGLPFASWWAELEPLLTQQAQFDYAYVDPANIPATAVTGPAVLTDETSAYVATVAVPTDVGTYTVVLTRADGEAPWLASRLTPPDGIG